MGVEVKGAGDGVVIADRGCNDNCCCGNRNSGWGSGWGAVGGALVGGGFGAAAVSVWDKINDTKADIQKVESTVQEAKAGIYKDISDAAVVVPPVVFRAATTWLIMFWSLWASTTRFRRAISWSFAVFSMRHLISCCPFLRSQQQRSS